MTAVVVPGRKLLPDGTPPPILKARMETAVTACKEDASAQLMVLSGGKMPMNADERARISASGAGPPPDSEAEAMQRLAEQLGLTGVDVVLDTESLNTLENAANVLQLLRGRGLERLVVVTSSFHMPRVRQSFEGIFEGSGMQLTFLESSDEGLTAEEREREAAVEPAMIARLPPQCRIYRKFLEGAISLEEARRRFFRGDGRPHSDVWLIPLEEVEQQAQF
eukprot:CAMPEP_0171103378 /NCGR_PEP_ID=MMETSP0766_2-20121228/58886_1 /TAXON_ID=439317 /ORGANISM="Gambierdiscus australes, Strain CAWD 149" /LENGTH=221 /DNA_ID=CAMNT_0011563797 /DNA_START=44 /DNA_END=709 /DNA_ORIENTATION=+